MRPIGNVVRLQIQRASLKVDGMRWRRYDPAAIQAVPALVLEEGGVVGLDEWGAAVADVHHRDHPASKNRDGLNGISVGFTAHYDAMRARFGDHLVAGIAGENILVQTDRPYTEHDLMGRLVVDTEHGSVHLERVVVAAPCVEFSRFALRYPDDLRPDRSVSDALRFLHGGMRGYYATYRGQPVRVRLGDRVYLADAEE